MVTTIHESLIYEPERRFGTRLGSGRDTFHSFRRVRYLLELGGVDHFYNATETTGSESVSGGTQQEWAGTETPGFCSGPPPYA